MQPRHSPSLHRTREPPHLGDYTDMAWCVDKALHTAKLIELEKRWKEARVEQHATKVLLEKYGT